MLCGLRRTVALDAALGSTLRVQSERHAPCETGGILMGLARRGSIEITHLVDAGPGAERGPHRFVPDGSWQRQRVADLYHQSSRTLAYLGDWHSHPLGGTPSELDNSTAARIADTPAARCAEPLFLIVTWEQTCWDLVAYQYRRRQFRRVDVVER